MKVPNLFNQPSPEPRPQEYRQVGEVSTQICDPKLLAAWAKVCITLLHCLCTNWTLNLINSEAISPIF